MVVVDAIGIDYFQKQKKISALQDVSFKVEDGEIFGIVGPDGAGKTSLLRILATLLLPSRGSAIIDGYDIVRDFREIRHILGYMPGKFSLYLDLSVEENLYFFARIFDTTIRENYHQVEEIYQQLKPFKNRKAGALSGGMKQKLALCCALIHGPRVLLLDEPTTGVDPISREEFWIALKRLKNEGISIVVSTPYMDEASMCDRIGLMFGGKLLDIDTPLHFTVKYDKPLFAFCGENMYKLLLDIRQFNGVVSCYTFGDSLHVAFQDIETERLLEDWLCNRGHINFHAEKIHAGIEDYFMMLMDKNNGTSY